MYDQFLAVTVIKGHLDVIEDLVAVTVFGYTVAVTGMMVLWLFTVGVAWQFCS